VRGFFARLLTRGKEGGMFLKNVAFLMLFHVVCVEVSSFLGCFAMSAGKDLLTFRRSVSMYSFVNNIPRVASQKT